MKKIPLLLIPLIISFLTSCKETPPTATEDLSEQSKQPYTTTTHESTEPGSPPSPVETISNYISPEERRRIYREGYVVPPDELTEEELRLWKSIDEQVDQGIKEYDFGDYNNDGKLEMFAAFYDYVEEFGYELWFSDGLKVELVADKSSTSNAYFAAYQVGYDRFYVAKSLGLSGFWRIYGVKNGKPYLALSLFGFVTLEHYEENNQLVFYQTLLGETVVTILPDDSMILTGKCVYEK